MSITYLCDSVMFYSAIHIKTVLERYLFLLLYWIAYKEWWENFKNKNKFLDFFEHLLNFTEYFLVHQLQDNEVISSDTGLQISCPGVFNDFFAFRPLTVDHSYLFSHF